MILYSKTHDQLRAISFESPTQDDKEQLIRSFDVAGLLDEQMEERIDEHFSVAREAMARLVSTVGKDKEVTLDPETILIFPLIGRTKAIVEYARELEEERQILFLPIEKFERIVNTFYHGKTIKIDENGRLQIVSSDSKKRLHIQHLSSGEKQILILLVQALLWEGRPVVYVADEPELSLHVLWQEKLLKSLVDLGKNIQIIVATHSPDIIGPYTDKVINLGEFNQ
jgi:ABC-type dipeptide/oligopeptide/nickel transport system ATPase component